MNVRRIRTPRGRVVHRAVLSGSRQAITACGMILNGDVRETAELVSCRRCALETVRWSQTLLASVAPSARRPAA